LITFIRWHHQSIDSLSFSSRCSACSLKVLGNHVTDDPIIFLASASFRVCPILCSVFFRLSHAALHASDRVQRCLPFFLGLFLSSPHTRPMSQTRPNSESKALSNSNYQQIFSVALDSYEKRTGNDLRSNPLLPRLETCNSPDAVIALFREQIPGFDQSRSDNDPERLSNWLNPTVNVIVAFSGAIGDFVSPAGLST
jgi:hypothetical protein